VLDKKGEIIIFWSGLKCAAFIFCVWDGVGDRGWLRHNIVKTKATITRQEKRDKMCNTLHFFGRLLII
jgi:hypothetical protein